MFYRSAIGGIAAAIVVAAQVGVSGAQAPSTSDYSTADVASGAAWKNVSEIALENMQNNINSRSDATCTYENAQVRKEWRALDEATRKSFTDAVTCLYNLPPRYMTSDQASSYPGVKNRYDEYVATHINYTLNIHDTADFLAWHRRLASLWEQDLKDSCGYTGALPYWNWAIDAQAPQDSPLFSGDEYSIGSNGEYISGRSSTYLATQDVTYPAGTGGGCVYSGPFTDYTVNLGPLDLPNYNNVNSSFEYNPHCLQRDINPWFTQNYNTYTNLTQSILDYIYIETFQDYMQGYGANNPFGIHGGGHWQSGGNMMDFHSSPADPLFFLHHAMIDNVWTTWQNLDITRRQNVIYGTSTLGNSPPSADMSLDDVLPFGFVTDEPQVFGDLMDTFSGPFCYRYDITP